MKPKCFGYLYPGRFEPQIIQREGAGICVCAGCEYINECYEKKKDVGLFKPLQIQQWLESNVPSALKSALPHIEAGRRKLLKEYKEGKSTPVVHVDPSGTTKITSKGRKPKEKEINEVTIATIEKMYVEGNGVVKIYNDYGKLHGLLAPDISQILKDRGHIIKRGRRTE